MKTILFNISLIVLISVESHSFAGNISVSKVKKDKNKPKINVATKSKKINSPAPNFTLTDLEGKKVSLNDFKGKVVYMDIWATWCSPCVYEMNKSGNLKEKFKDNSNVVFLYVSIDTDVDKWKSFVQKKDIHGVHLISPKGQAGDIIKNYKASTIPRFILIDKAGNIADANAKRPSEAELISDIEKLL